jgi:hypothetical protein
MGCSLAENTRPPRHIYSHRATLELVREKFWVLLHTTSIMQVLYIPPCAVHGHARVTLLLGGTFAARLHAPKSRNALFFLFLLRFAPTHVYCRELSVHSLDKEEIREGEGETEKKLKSDGRSIGKRRNVKTPSGVYCCDGYYCTVVFSYVLYLKNYHLSQLQRVLGHDGPGSRYYSHGVAYACRRPSSCRLYVVRSPVVLARLCVSRSLQKVDARVTIVSYGCTSEAIFIIVRPWKLRSCLTAKEQYTVIQYVFSGWSFARYVESNAYTRCTPS